MINKFCHVSGKALKTDVGFMVTVEKVLQEQGLLAAEPAWTDTVGCKLFLLPVTLAKWFQSNSEKASEGAGKKSK